ncbi:hypothetical protein [Corallococcus llansteffanensis]|uniref:Uncharacterized protein n=1 Tax=Corallococcus llansteffanensis TaxID=2316731 RepID=A0A3A8Q0K7_9BACT|nr:hypothetical protein [Corallococcus llansteffanensis]RKH62297.1 hypothetical protein D7V93_10325 [Corallococcus llansteffanensis]
MPLTYDLLLDLYRGKSAAVEQIGHQSEVGALAIDTPVTALISALDAGHGPKHLVLTGSAGDGKTFAALTAKTKDFEVITDASARRLGVTTDPIADLAAQVEEVLRLNRRLLLAINRGQLERLYDHARGSTKQQVRVFAEIARSRTALRPSWEATAVDVAVADLGHLDRQPTVEAMLDKVLAIPDSPYLAPPTREAFALAKGALSDRRVREWVALVVRSASSAGANVTMRQLWSFVAFLATGARAPSDERPVGLADAVGARLFAGEINDPLFSAARQECDPAVTPDASLTRRILAGDLLARMKGSPLKALAADREGWRDGRRLIRIAAVHGLAEARALSLAEDQYGGTVQQLLKEGPGWHAFGPLVRVLVGGIYSRLGLWKAAAILPSWQMLCYDTARSSSASLVADRDLNASRFKLAVPRPPPDVEAFLLKAWRPPFVWLGTPDGPRLRLMPRTFRGLIIANERLVHEDLFASERWLARAGSASATESPESSTPVRVARRGDPNSIMLDDALDLTRTEITIEGGTVAGGTA